MKIKLGLVILIIFAFVLATCSTWEGNESIVNIRLVAANGGSGGSRTLIGQGNDATYPPPLITNPYYIPGNLERLTDYHNGNLPNITLPELNQQFNEFYSEGVDIAWTIYKILDLCIVQKENQPFSSYLEKNNNELYNEGTTFLKFTEYLKKIENYDFDIYFVKKLYNEGEKIPKDNVGASRGGDVKLGNQITLSLVPGTWICIVRGFEDKNDKVNNNKVQGVVYEVEIKPGKNEDIPVPIDNRPNPIFAPGVNF